MGKFGFFGGIDFSGAREPLSNLWSAIGEERDGRLCIRAIRPHAFRGDLAAYVSGTWRTNLAPDRASILWGVDFPFGIPREVGNQLAGAQAWPDIVAWIADRPAAEIRDAAGAGAGARRATDTGGAMPPLDLRLHKQTVEGLRWLHELMEETDDVSIRPQAVDPAATTTLIEVYPSGAAQELGLPRRRTPSRPGETRARAAALRTFLDFAEPNTEALCVNLEDAWDATLACLVAYHCRDDLDQPVRVAPNEAAAVACEGWIYRPPASLG